MAENCFINFMEGVNKFSSAERAKIAKSFREDLKHYKVGGAILNIVESTSDKVPVFINVMCQQARKKQFAADFTAECDRLRDIYKRNRTEVAQKIADLHKVVLDTLKKANDKKNGNECEETPKEVDNTATADEA